MGYMVIFILVVALFALYLKLAARILGRIRLSWKNSFVYVSMLVALTIAGRIVHTLFDFSLPLALNLLLALSAHLALGGWFFGTRASTGDSGHLIGWLGGIKLTATAWILMAASVFALLRLAHIR